MNYVTPSEKEFEQIIKESLFAVAANAPWGQDEVLVIMAIKKGGIIEYLVTPKHKGAVLADYSFGIYHTDKPFKNRKEAENAVYKYCNLEFKKPLKIAGVFDI